MMLDGVSDGLIIIAPALYEAIVTSWHQIWRETQSFHYWFTRLPRGWQYFLPVVVASIMLVAATVPENTIIGIDCWEHLSEKK